MRYSQEIYQEVFLRCANGMLSDWASESKDTPSELQCCTHEGIESLKRALKVNGIDITDDLDFNLLYCLATFNFEKNPEMVFTDLEKVFESVDKDIRLREIFKEVTCLIKTQSAPSSPREQVLEDAQSALGMPTGNSPMSVAKSHSAPSSPRRQAARSTSANPLVGQFFNQVSRKVDIAILEMEPEKKNAKNFYEQLKQQAEALYSEVMQVGTDCFSFVVGSVRFLFSYKDAAIPDVSTHPYTESWMVNESVAELYSHAICVGAGKTKKMDLHECDLSVFLAAIEQRVSEDEALRKEEASRASLLARPPSPSP